MCASEMISTAVALKLGSVLVFKVCSLPNRPDEEVLQGYERQAESGVSTAMGENILQVTGVIPGLPSALKMRNFWCFLGLFSGQLSIKLSKKALALNS